MRATQKPWPPGWMCNSPASPVPRSMTTVRIGAGAKTQTLGADRATSGAPRGGRPETLRRGAALEREGSGDQLVRAAARRVVVRDRHDEHLVGAVLRRDLLEPGAHGVRCADDGAPSAGASPMPASARNASAFSTVGTAISRPRRSSVIAMRWLAASRCASSSRLGADRRDADGRLAAARAAATGAKRSR